VHSPGVLSSEVDDALKVPHGLLVASFVSGPPDLLDNRVRSRGSAELDLSERVHLAYQVCAPCERCTCHLEVELVRALPVRQPIGFRVRQS